MSEETKCPYPCGWSKLNTIVTEKAAYFAGATIDDDIPEQVRQAGIYVGQIALELIKHSRHIPEGFALVPVEQAQNGKRYEFLRGRFGYGDIGLYLPCGFVRDRQHLAKCSDAAIDKAIAAAQPATEEVE